MTAKTPFNAKLFLVYFVCPVIPSRILNKTKPNIVVGN
jgi:hypothetical protein